MDPQFPPIAHQSDDLEEKYDDESEEEEDKQDDPNMFYPPQSLDPPIEIRHKLKYLHGLIHEGKVDLNPPWQRDVVWAPSKMEHLIESIFSNYSIPQIVFAEVHDEEIGDNIYLCVDGKQRLTSVQRFFDGQIAYKHPRTKKRWFYTPNDNSKLEVPENYKSIFNEKELTCVIYKNLPSGAEREIFQRVQLGMALTPAEKIQAKDSPWTSWINELLQIYIHSEGGILEYVKWDHKRGRDFQGLSFMIYCCDDIGGQPTPTTPRVSQWLDRVDAPSKTFRGEVQTTLSNFLRLAMSYKATFKNFGKSLAPVEFVYIGVLLYQTRDLSLDQMNQGVCNLRRIMRQHYPTELRLNEKVERATWGFIDDIIINLSPSQSSNVKRKRGNDDEEYHPLPVKKLNSPAKTRSKRS